MEVSLPQIPLDIKHNILLELNILSASFCFCAFDLLMETFQVTHVHHVQASALTHNHGITCSSVNLIISELLVIRPVANRNSLLTKLQLIGRSKHLKSKEIILWLLILDSPCPYLTWKNVKMYSPFNLKKDIENPACSAHLIKPKHLFLITFTYWQ